MIKKALFLGLALLLGAAAVIFLIQQTNTLNTTYFTWQHSRVPPEFEGFRIVQISDLHNKRFGREQRRLLRAIRDAEPNLIVITGDMIDESTRGLEPVEELLAGIAGLAPIYYIDGNHDVRSWLYEDMLELFERYGVTVLQGAYFMWYDVDTSQRPADTRLEHNGATMTMGTIASLEADIVLIHDPAKFLYYTEVARDGLVLAGHMHGGQIALPNGRAIVGPFSDNASDRPFTLFPPFSSGVYVQGDATMFLSRGLGTSHLPLRAFATPEIAVIELKPE